MRSRRQPPPPVHVDADEDRLDEEREALDREAQPEHRPERGHEVGPQQAHLEAEDRAGDDPDREQRDHHLAPPLGERQVQLVASAQVQPLDEDHHRRERDPEAHQRDVHDERQGLHLSRLRQVLLVHRRQRECA